MDMRVHMYVHTHAHTHTHMHAHMHLYVHAHVHTQIHPNIHQDAAQITNIHHNDDVIVALGKCVTTGCNVNGQLGYHRSHQETQPGVVKALGQNVTMVTCGDSYTAAVTKGMNCIVMYVQWN